jgi:segregation and condensation protein A
MDPTEQIEWPYRVRLQQFEGPLDLLLHLIKKNQINIYDIPIATITQQYLEYLEMMKSLNLAVVGEFLVIAATLVQIKSRMLLPSDAPDLDEEEGPDPRAELVRRLLEYRQFKEAARQLAEREQLWRNIYTRELADLPALRSEEWPLDEVSLFELVDALHAVLERRPGSRLVEVVPDTLTVQDRITVILDLLGTRESFMFHSLFEGPTPRLVVIVALLAVLELARQRLVRVLQDKAFGPILVRRSFTPAAEDEPLVR